jgi:hypothetical protein
MRCIRLVLPLCALVACQTTQPSGSEKTPSTTATSTTGTPTPAETEVCDGVDNDGDGQIDEGLTTVYYADTDDDGYGDPSEPLEACERPDGYATDPDDCNDDDPNQWTTDTHDHCDGLDNNCNGDRDEDHRNDWWLGTINDGVLYEIDRQTALVTPVIALTGEGAAYTINSTDSWEGNLIVVHNLGLGVGTLQDFDSCTGALSTIGVTGTGSLPGIGFGPDGFLYAVEAGADTIIRVDPNTANWSNLLSLGFNLNNSGAAYDCTEERLWFADATNSQIFWVDPAAGTTGGFQPTNVPLDSVGLEWDPATRTLWAATGSELWTIDPATGNGTRVGAFDTPNTVGTLALFPPCGTTP